MRTIQPASVRRTVEVKTSAAHAFEVFTVGIGRWWPPSHTIGKGKLKTAVIEPRVGGRWYGEDEDGATTEWGKVLAFEPPSRVVLAWQISDQWRFDPKVMTEVEVRFTPIAAKLTRVDLEHRHLERLGPEFEKIRTAFESPDGWGALIKLYAAAAEAT
jgi:uncharacterized protein YndB with AHSA1/START domain